MTKKIEMDAIAFTEQGHWLVHGVQYDVSAQALTLSEALKRFQMTCCADALHSRFRNGEPMKGIDPAPEEVLKRWSSASKKHACSSSEDSIFKYRVVVEPV